jgi:hypothetical protein
MPIACLSGTAPPCFSSLITNYNSVELSIDGGATYTPMTKVSGDNWTVNVVVSGVTFKIESECGNINPLVAGYRITHLFAPIPVSNYQFTAVTGTYPYIYTGSSTAGQPTAWPGGPVIMRVSVKPGVRQQTSGGGNRSTDVHILAGFNTLAGNSVVAWFGQDGTDVSGGTLLTPTTPTGFVSTDAASDKRLYCYTRIGGAGITDCHVLNNGAGDLQWLFIAELWTPPGGALRGHAMTVNGGATLNPSTPTVSDAGVLSTFYGVVVQIRNGLTNQSAPTLSSPTGGFTAYAQRVDQQIGGFPIFETYGARDCSFAETATASRSCSFTSTRSQAVWSGLAAVG